MYSAEKIKCTTCGADFIFTVSEQRFYYDVMGWVSKPKRCSACREAEKALRKGA